MPRKRAKNPRIVPIPTRYSEVEKERITQAANDAGVTLSDFIRSRALDSPLPPPRTSRKRSRPTVRDGEKLALLLRAVGAIGNNHNQLAHIANSGLWPEAQAINQGLDDIQWMRDTLMMALGFEVNEKQEREA